MRKIPRTTLQAGAVLAGRYRVSQLIARGAMGEVYQARDERLDRDVAVKIIDTDPSIAATTRGAAEREAQAAARLAHPGIARVFDVGLEGDAAYLVMELVNGRTLHERMRNGPLLSPAESTEIAAQLADALDYAHRHGVIHCDVKPQNILLTSGGVPKLVDFGIARVISATRTLAPDELSGSAPYVAPEQVRGEHLDGRADIYALGAVLFELLTGRPPFVGDTLAAILSQRLVADPPSPRSVNPNVPIELDRIVLTALAREPADRYRDSGAFRDALRSVMEPPAAEAPTVPIATEAPRESVGVTGSRKSRSRPALTRLAILAAGITVTTGLAVAFTGPRTEATAPPTPTVEPPPVLQLAPEPSGAPILAPSPSPVATDEMDRAVLPATHAIDARRGESTATRPALTEAKPKAEQRASDDDDSDDDDKEKKKSSSRGRPDRRGDRD